MDSGHQILAHGEEVLNPNYIYVREMNPKNKKKKKKKNPKLNGYKLQFNQSFLGKSALTSLKVFCYHTRLLTNLK